jgi:hypothetical protein
VEDGVHRCESNVLIGAAVTGDVVRIEQLVIVDGLIAGLSWDNEVTRDRVGTSFWGPVSKKRPQRRGDRRQAFLRRSASLGEATKLPESSSHLSRNHVSAGRIRRSREKS